MTALAVALARWQHAAGAYWPYVCAAPFLGDALPPANGAVVGEGHGPSAAARLPVLARAFVETLAAIPSDIHPAIFVDLPPDQSLAAAADLVDAGFVVVPIIQRWVSSPAVLDCRPLVARLLRSGRQVRRPSVERGVVFFLDGDRDGLGAARVETPRAFDNRYQYPTDRFPPASFLVARGVDVLYWIAPAGIAPDLQSYAAELREHFPERFVQMAAREPRGGPKPRAGVEGA